MVSRPDSIAVLKDKNVQASLTRYFAAMQNQKPAKFMIAKKLAASFSGDSSEEELWEKHTKLTEEFRNFEIEVDSGLARLEQTATPAISYLDLKTELAGRILSACHLCARGCRVNRLEGEVGYCGCGREITVSSIFEHMGEEPELVPSGTIFTVGCSMRCKHCQNYTISQRMEVGKAFLSDQLAQEVEKLRNNGCRNANLVGGDPTPWLQQWLQTFKHVRANLPIVWNSNTYYSLETAQILAGFVDVYLLDFKYGPGECAERIANAPGYWEACTRNHLEAKKYGELIIRVLVLPDHLECCTKPTLKWIAENLGTGTRVNVMFQYRPEWRAREVPELRRRLTGEEMQRAVHLAREARLSNFIT